MERRDRLGVFIRAVYMTVFYQFAGMCISTVAASVSMEFYRAHLMLWTFLAAAITIPFCLMQMKRDGFLEGEHGFHSEGVSAGTWLLLIFLGVSSCIALNYWIELSGLAKRFNGYAQVAETIYRGKIAEEFLAVVLAAPVVEELLFRGIAYNGFKRLWGQRAAMVLAAVFFGVYHRNMVQFVYAFLLGLMLVYVYEAFGTIRASILFHISANAASVILTECLDLSWLKEDSRAMLALASVFTLAGFLSIWRIRAGIKGRQRKTEGN